MGQSLLKTFIIGGGRGCSALIPILLNKKNIDIVGVCDHKKNAPGILMAKKLGISTHLDFKNFLKKNSVNLIIDVSGSPEVNRILDKMKKPGVEILGGLSSKLLWGLVNERKKRETEIEQNLVEQEALYNIGVMLISAKNIDMVFRRIVQCAINLSKTKAGSLALYEEKTDEFKMVVSIGFSEAFSKIQKWKFRKDGLTNYILSNEKPTVIEDISKSSLFNNSIVRQESIKSLLAVPLTLREKIIGILYVNEFKPKKFNAKITSLMAFLATMATFAIEKSKLLEDAEQLAITDELTQLYNHRYFVQTLEKEINRSKRFQYPICFLMLDIDHFKNYNDHQGHQNGNIVLKIVARLMQENIREIDILARYGGEEFSVILPGVESDGGKVMAERIRKSIENHTFPFCECQPGKKLTISIGLACYPKDTDNGPDLIHKADNALYKAKRFGRNKVVVFMQDSLIT